MKPETIPYIVHEDQMVRQERTIKRLWILCIIIFLALIGTNAGCYYDGRSYGGPYYGGSYDDGMMMDDQQM